MKKLILSFVSMMVVVAHAAPSYWAAIETSAYTGDKSKGGNIANYAMYYCTVESAATLFNGSSVDDIEDYIAKNFATAKSMATTFDSVAFSDDEYHILDYVGDSFDSSAYVAFVLYGSDAYRVYGAGSATLTPYGSLVFNESSAATGTVGDWQLAFKPTISGVTARQRYPWNGKVDIAYTTSNVLATAIAKGINVEPKVMAIEKSTTPWTTNVAEAACLFVGPRGIEPLTAEAAFSNGAHRIVWDMNAQGLFYKSGKVVFVVSAEGKAP